MRQHQASEPCSLAFRLLCEIGCSLMCLAAFKGTGYAALDALEWGRWSGGLPKDHLAQYCLLWHQLSKGLNREGSLPRPNLELLIARTEWEIFYMQNTWCSSSDRLPRETLGLVCRSPWMQAIFNYTRTNRNQWLKRARKTALAACPAWTRRWLVASHSLHFILGQSLILCPWIHEFAELGRTTCLFSGYRTFFCWTVGSIFQSAFLQLKEPGSLFLKWEEVSLAGWKAFRRKGGIQILLIISN